jgi:hypothetical protein
MDMLQAVAYRVRVSPVSDPEGKGDVAARVGGLGEGERVGGLGEGEEAEE